MNILIAAILLMASTFSYAKEFLNIAQSIEKSTDLALTQDREFVIKSDNSTFKVFVNKTIKQRSRLFTDVVVKSGENIIWQGKGLFSDVVYSNMGDSLLLVKITKKGLTEYIVINDDIKVSKVKRKPLKTLAHIYSFYHQISDSGNTILRFKAVPDGGLVNITKCEVKLPATSCKKIFKNAPHTISDVSLVNDNEVVTFNTTIEIVESGKKVDYLFKGYIEKYDGENLVWRHQMPLENDWSGGALDTYGEVFVVKSDKELHIKDLVTGDTVWSMNRNEAEHELKSFNSIFVYQGLLILPFASEQGMYRRSLSLN